MAITIVNKVLVPSVFPGNPVPSGGGYNYNFGFTTTPGTAIIAVICCPFGGTIETQPWDGISRFKLDNGDAFQGVVGCTPQLSDCSGFPCPGSGTPPDTLINNSNDGVNIYWIPSNSGGATALASIVSAGNFDMWIYEVDFGGGTPAVLASSGYSNSLDNFHGGPPVSSISSGNVDGGAAAFYVAGCGQPDTTTTVNSPFTLDTVDWGGGYMTFGSEDDCAAAYYVGSGVQNCTFSIADGPISSYNVGTLNAAIAAFGVAGSNCGTGTPPVGDGTIKSGAKSVL